MKVDQKKQLMYDLAKELFVKMCAAEFHELRNHERDNPTWEAIKMLNKNASSIAETAENLAISFVNNSSFIDEDEA